MKYGKNSVSNISWDPGETKKGGLSGVLRLLRIEHTLFSLPFAYMGAFISGNPTLRELFWITIAVFSLRSAAMAFNNIADLEIDRLNPRSAKRPLVIGSVSLKHAWGIVIAGALLYFLSAYELNIPSCIMSPIPIILALSYPYAKRIHSWPHVHLGLVLALVVLGGSFGVLGDKYSNILTIFSKVPWLLMISIILWVAGFDIVYSIMDIDFDREMRLGSIPARYGIKSAKIISLIFHVIMFLLLFLGIQEYNLGDFAYLTIIIAAILTFYGHFKVYKSQENIKLFFNLNLAIGLIISVGVILGRLIPNLHVLR